MRFVFEESPPPACGAKRGKRSKTRCELLPGHDHQHTGRSPSGRWFSWQVGEVHDTLVRIRERLSDPKAWTKGCRARNAHDYPVHYADPAACSWCLNGATLVELDNPGGLCLHAAVLSDPYVAVTGALNAQIPQNTIVYFNDCESTEHHHVLEALDRAIEKTA